MSAMRALYIFLLITCCAFNVDAQKMTLGYIFPAGGAKGDSLDIEIAGLNVQNAKEIIVSGDGIKTRLIKKPDVFDAESKGQPKKSLKLNDQSSPQLANRIYVRVYIDKDATLGLRDLRLKSTNGTSNKLFFEVSTYPNQVRYYDSSLPIDTFKVNKLPSVLCGQVKPGGVNSYIFEAVQGSDYVVSVNARSLLPYIADAVPGWFQPVIKITDIKGRELAYNDDYRFSPDPFIVFTPEEKGQYILSIHDAIFRGREDFAYRITFGEIPFVTEVSPAVAFDGKKNKFEVSGVNFKSKVFRLTPQMGKTTQVKLNGQPVVLPLPVTTADHSQSIYDSIIQKYEVKEYNLNLKKGENFKVDVLARRLGSRADLCLRLLSSDGKMIAESDDVDDPSQGMMTFHADPQINVEIEESGSYKLLVSELMGQSGKDCFYLITYPQKSNDFRAFVSPSNISIPSGGTTILKFDFDSKAETNPIASIHLTGLPQDFSTSPTAIPQKGQSFELSVTAPEGAQSGPLNVTPELVFADGQTESISSVDNMMQAFYYTHRLPAAEFTMDVIPASPYNVRVTSKQMDKDGVIRLTDNDEALLLSVEVQRRDGFDKPIGIELSRKVKQFSYDNIELSPNESRKEIRLPIVKGAFNKQKQFRLQLYVVATVDGEIQKNGKRTFSNSLYREVSPIFNVTYTKATAKKIFMKNNKPKTRKAKNK